MISRIANRKRIIIFSTIQLAALLLVLWAMICVPGPVADRIQIIPAVITAAAATNLIIKKEADYSSKEGSLAGAALYMILCGDLFLCFLYGSGFEPGLLIGYLFFSICQILFACSMGISKKNLIIRLMTFVGMEIILWKIGMMQADNFWGILNLSQLLINVFTSWYIYYRKRVCTNLLRAAGFTSFAGCDYGLLVWALLPAASSLHRPVGLFVWICYVPAQVLLLLAWYLKGLRTCENG